MIKSHEYFKQYQKAISEELGHEQPIHFNSIINTIQHLDANNAEHVRFARQIFIFARSLCEDLAEDIMNYNLKIDADAEEESEVEK